MINSVRYYRETIKTENTEGAIKNGQCRVTGNLWYTTRRHIIQVRIINSVRYYRETIKTEKTEGAIKNGQSRETGNLWYTTRRQIIQVRIINI